MNEPPDRGVGLPIEIDVVRGPGGTFVIVNATGNPPEARWRSHIPRIRGIFGKAGSVGFLLTRHRGRRRFDVRVLCPDDDYPAPSPGALQACAAAIRRLYGYREMCFQTPNGASTATLFGGRVQLTLDTVPGVQPVADPAATEVASVRSFVICRHGDGPAAVAEIPPPLRSFAPVTACTRVTATLNADRSGQRLHTRSTRRYQLPGTAVGEAIAAVVAGRQFGMLRPGRVEVLGSHGNRQSLVIGPAGPPFSHVEVDGELEHLLIGTVHVPPATETSHDAAHRDTALA